MGSLLQNTVFGRSNYKVNTYIGGVGPTINTPALLAEKLGIATNRIKLFRIVDNDIECMIIGGSYTLAANAFINNTAITYFFDNDYLITSIGANAFFNASNLGAISELRNCVSIGVAVFFNNQKITTIIAPKLTTVGEACFKGMNKVTEFNFPKLEIINSASVTGNTGTFEGCTLLERLYVPKCTTITGYRLLKDCQSLKTFFAPQLRQLGISVSDDSNLFNIKIDSTITVSSYLRTVNSGSPDGDLVYAAETRGAIIVYQGVTIVGAYTSNYQKSHDNGASFISGGYTSLTRGIAISENLKYVLIAHNGGVVLSSDFGVTFSNTTLTSTVYYCASMSDNGQYMLVSQSSGNTYLSIDYGVTWNLAVTAGMRDCFVSSTGQYMIATISNSSIISRSTDYGITWTSLTGNESISAVCCSDDGQIILSSSYNGTIRISNDGGVTWTNKTVYGLFIQPEVAMSIDGKYQIVTGQNKYVHISSDFGVTWTANTNTFNNLAYSCVSVSKDGKFQSIGVSNGFIYVSSDFGVTWTQKGLSLNYQAMAISR